MTLEQTYYISEILVGIGFIVSIIFLAAQMRQNSYLLRKSMADKRSQRVIWQAQTISTNADFRDFERRIDTEYTTFDADEKFRANMMGVRTLSSILDELLAHFDGQISDDEWINLQWNMTLAIKRPNVQAAYLWLKDGYSKKVQDYWEALDASGEGRTVADLATPN